MSKRKGISILTDEILDYDKKFSSKNEDVIQINTEVNSEDDVVIDEKIEGGEPQIVVIDPVPETAEPENPDRGNDKQPVNIVRTIIRSVFSNKARQKGVSLIPSKWEYDDSGMWSMFIKDNSICSGDTLSVWTSDTHSKREAGSAYISGEIEVSEGGFRISATVKPSKVINVLYMVL